MNDLILGIFALTVAVPIYAYVLYPLILMVLPPRRADAGSSEAGGDEDWEWPTITITVPAYNEAAQIRQTIESLLQIDYPRDRRQILIVSDASDDGTDDIVREFADRGVELFRAPGRVGKTAAENLAQPLLRGEIVVNTDASIRIDPGAVKALVGAFRDPSVGVASSRDVSVSRAEVDAMDPNQGESGYVGYEMWVRGLETRVYGIVGASGSLYAIRRDLHCTPLPDGLSRDFSSALVARYAGLRAVSVDRALAFVPRTPSLRIEYRRKVRTMTRGMETLWFWRRLHNPFRYGIFSWMLLSHKLFRWLVPWCMVLFGIALAAWSVRHPLAWILFVGGTTVVVLGVAGWFWPRQDRIPRVLSVPAYAVAGNVAALHSWLRAIRGDRNPIWEPTRR